MDDLTQQEIKAIFDVVNVFEPEDINHVYPEMATEEFMNDVNSAWKKILKTLNDKSSWHLKFKPYYVVCMYYSYYSY